MLGCPVKQLTGIECPGCGMQRSAAELMAGNLSASLALYPALIPMGIMLIFLALHLRYKFRQGSQILKYLYIINTVIVFGFYIYKQIHFHTQ